MYSDNVRINTMTRDKFYKIKRRSYGWLNAKIKQYKPEATSTKIQCTSTTKAMYLATQGTSFETHKRVGAHISYNINIITWREIDTTFNNSLRTICNVNYQSCHQFKVSLQPQWKPTIHMQNLKFTISYLEENLTPKNGHWTNLIVPADDGRHEQKFQHKERERERERT